MATYYFRNTGNTSWGVSTNWSLTSGGPANGAVPTATDTANIDANSGACNMNISGVCAILNCTGYTSTLTLTNGLTVSGNITLASGMTIAGSGTITINAAGTITTNTIVIPNLTTLVNGGIVTFADNCNVSGTFSITTSSNNSTTLNSNTVYCASLYQNTGFGGCGGTTSIIMNSTGTWSANYAGGYLGNNLTFAAGSGTITISGSVMKGSNLTYTSGTIVATGSTIYMNRNLNGTPAGPYTLNLGASNTYGSMVFLDINSYTLSTNINLSGNLGLGTISNNSYSINGNSIFIGGNLTINTIGGTISGTTTFVMNGTGTWSYPSTNTIIANNVTFNTSGTITLSGTFYYITGTITYLSGNVICDSTLLLNIQGSCTLSTNTGVIWTNISCLTQFLTITLGSDVYTKKFTYGGPGGNNQQLLVINGNTLYLGSLIQNGGTAVNSTLSGTTTLYFNGTGYNTITIPGNANGTVLNQVTVNNNIIINTSGTLAIIGVEPFCYGSGTLTYLAGNVYSNITQNTTYSNNFPTYGPTSIMTDFYINGNCTLVNIHKIPFKSIQIAGGSTVTMSQFFNGSPKNTTYIQSTNTSNYTITFQNSFEKISNFIKISNCTLTRPLQLLITTKNANKGNNIGIRYINQLPNGIARKTTTMPTNLTGSDFIQMVGGLPNDPTKF